MHPPYRLPKIRHLYASDAATFDDDYNQGNALAMSGQLERAVTGYDQALKLKPDDEDATFNRDLVAKLLEQQKKEEQQKQDQQQQASGEQPQEQQQQADARNAFQKAMDELLSGNGNTADGGDAKMADDESTPVAVSGYSEQDQAIEQQLRTVPDDPSGLLRARIHQHYAQQRAGRS